MYKLKKEANLITSKNELIKSDEFILIINENIVINNCGKMVRIRFDEIKNIFLKKERVFKVNLLMSIVGVLFLLVNIITNLESTFKIIIYLLSVSSIIFSLVYKSISYTFIVLKNDGDLMKIKVVNKHLKKIKNLLKKMDQDKKLWRK